MGIAEREHARERGKEGRTGEGEEGRERRVGRRGGGRDRRPDRPRHLVDEAKSAPQHGALKEQAIRQVLYIAYEKASEQRGREGGGGGGGEREREKRREQGRGRGREREERRARSQAGAPGDALSQIRIPTCLLVAKLERFVGLLRAFMCVCVRARVFAATGSRVNRRTRDTYRQMHTHTRQPTLRCSLSPARSSLRLFHALWIFISGVCHVMHDALVHVSLLSGEIAMLYQMLTKNFLL